MLRYLTKSLYGIAPSALLPLEKIIVGVDETPNSFAKIDMSLIGVSQLPWFSGSMFFIIKLFQATEGSSEHHILFDFLSASGWIANGYRKVYMVTSFSFANASFSSFLQKGQSISEKIAILLLPFPLMSFMALSNGNELKLTKVKISNLSLVKSFFVFGSTKRPSTIKKLKFLSV